MNELSTYDRRRLRERVNRAHARVLEAYEKHSLVVGPVSIAVMDEGTLTQWDAFERENLSLTNTFSVAGTYSSWLDSIMLDMQVCLTTPAHDLKRIIAHEYGHRIINRFMNAVHNGEPIRANLDLPMLPGVVDTNYDEENELRKKMDEYHSQLEKQRLTPLEKKRMEFSEYIEEMFVESAAHYVLGNTNADDVLWEHSRTRCGELLPQDEDFFERLEAATYRLFYERMFSRGLVNTILEYPFVELHMTHAFELNNTPQLRR